jgi:hypothetical protein
VEGNIRPVIQRSLCVISIVISTQQFLTPCFNGVENLGVSEKEMILRPPFPFSLCVASDIWKWIVMEIKTTTGLAV